MPKTAVIDLHRIAACALVLSSTSSCFLSGADPFSSDIRPSNAESGVAVSAEDCPRICGNDAASSCSITLSRDDSITLLCLGEQRAAGNRSVGDDCHYSMGHPRAISCRYTRAQGDELHAEWRFHFSSTHGYEGDRLYLHEKSCVPWCGKEVPTCNLVPSRSGFHTNCSGPTRM